VWSSPVALTTTNATLAFARGRDDIASRLRKNRSLRIGSNDGDGDGSDA
jgi:hypothetical protein